MSVYFIVLGYAYFGSNYGPIFFLCKENFIYNYYTWKVGGDSKGKLTIFLWTETQKLLLFICLFILLFDQEWMFYLTIFFLPPIIFLYPKVECRMFFTPVENLSF